MTLEVYPDGQIRTSKGVIIEDYTLSGNYIPSLTVTDLNHWLRHQGDSYVVSDSLTVTASSTYYFYFKVNAGKEVHLESFEFVSTKANAELVLYEGGTVTANGTAMTPRNNNRNGTDNLGIVFYKDSTVTVDGTQLEHTLLVGGKQSGGNVDGDEIVLNDDTVYLFKYINSATQDDKISFHINFLDIA